MSTQTLANKLGNEIGEAKRRLLDRVGKGSDLEDSIAQFIGEVRLGLQTVARKEKESTENSLSPV